MQPSVPEGRRDADQEHVNAFKAEIAKAKKHYFDDPFGDRQLHLQILATHPNYRRRGAATKLCKVGMELAANNDLIVSLFASPMGRDLYKHLDFQEVIGVFVQVDGDLPEEQLDIKGMRWEKAMSEPKTPRCICQSCPRHGSLIRHKSSDFSIGTNPGVGMEEIFRRPFQRSSASTDQKRRGSGLNSKGRKNNVPKLSVKGFS